VLLRAHTRRLMPRFAWAWGIRWDVEARSVGAHNGILRLQLAAVVAEAPARRRGVRGMALTVDLDLRHRHTGQKLRMEGFQRGCPRLSEADKDKAVAEDEERRAKHGAESLVIGLLHRLDVIAHAREVQADEEVKHDPHVFVVQCGAEARQHVRASTRL